MAGLVLFATFLAPPAGAAEESESFADALKKGKMSLNLRLRYENVTDDASASGKEAHATTLRTVLGYQSAAFKGFSLYAEAENVAVIGADTYNNKGSGSSHNGVTDRPVVADPAMTEINQALVRYQSDDWKMALGRQAVALADQRYVGPVGWRQNHQSFDAFRLDNSSNEKVGLTYVYIDRVNRIFDDSLDMSSHVLLATFDVQGSAKVTAYGLMLDYQDLAGLSTRTFGVELAGKKSFGENTFLYEAEIAEQSDAADNPGTIDAGYTFLMLGGALPRFTIKLGWEVLEGSPADGQFRTPLATLHKFNGWADKFLGTPPNGLEDIYLAVNGKAGKIGWLVKYHDFGAETESASYGEELDFQLLYTSPAKITFGLKGAFYNADQFSADTDKLMLWAAYKT